MVKTLPMTPFNMGKSQVKLLTILVTCGGFPPYALSATTPYATSLNGRVIDSYTPITVPASVTTDLTINPNGILELSTTLPGAQDSAFYISSGATLNINGGVLRPGPQSNRQMEIGWYAGGTTTINITNGGSFNSDDWTPIGRGGNAVNINVDGANSQFNAALDVQASTNFNMTASNGGTTRGGSINCGAGHTCNVIIGANSGSPAGGAGFINGNLIASGNGNTALVLNHTDNNYLLGSALNGTMRVNQIAGVTIMTANNNYSGGTTISGGTLQLGNGGTTGAVTGNITNNATLAVNRSNALTLAGIISGTGQLQQNGTGTTILTASNTYTGGTTISGGTLQLGNGGTTGAVTGDITNNATLAVNRSDALTLAGIISGTGRLQQNGTGTTVLTAGNTYTGGTTISGGTLQLGNGGTTGAVTGDITNNATLAVNRSDTLTLAQILSGTGQLQQNGTGTTVLTAGNTYTGGTTISGGTLQLGDGGTTGAVTGDITNNATLAVNRSDTLTLAGILSGTGQLQQNGTGTTVLTAGNTYTGGTTISGGTLQLGDGGTSGAVTGDITNNATLAVNRSDALALAGAISGTGQLQQNGTGTTVLTAGNTYTGGTTISGGTLQLGDGSTSGAVTGDITNNATLAVNRSDALTLNGSIIGSGALHKYGSGELISTGQYSLTEGTWVHSGALTFSGNTVSSDIVGTSGAQLNLINNATLTGWIDPLDVNIAKGSVWNMNGSANQNVLDNLTLAGSVNITAPDAAVGFSPRNLTVKNVTGQDGSITLNTRLGDSSSPTDKLIVDGGSATGSTTLAIRNAGGSGAPTTGDGILVVQALNSATTASNAFSLKAPVYAGAYEYSLLRGGRVTTAPDNWYLTTNQVIQQVVPEPPVGLAPPVEYIDTGRTNYRPGVSTASTIPVAAAAAVQATLSSFYDPTGSNTFSPSLLVNHPCEEDDTRWCKDENRGWGRYINSNIINKGDSQGLQGHAGAPFQQSVNAIQLGTDLWHGTNEQGVNRYSGVYVALGTSKADVSRDSGSKAGQTHLDIYSLGGYFSQIFSNDARIDAILQGSWMSIRGQSEDKSSFSTEGSAVAASLEAGYPVLNHDGWKVEPHIRTLYQYQGINDTRDGFNDISYGNYASLRGTAAVRVSKSGEVKGQKYVLWVDGGAGREFLGDSDTYFGTENTRVALATRQRGNFAEIKGGGNISLNRTLSLYTSGNWTPRFDHKQYEYGATIGLRGTW